MIYCTFTVHYLIYCTLLYIILEAKSLILLETRGGRVPLLAPNISDLTPKIVRTIADKPYNCGQIADKMKGERWKSGRPIQPWSTQRITDKFLQFVTGNRHKYFSLLKRHSPALVQSSDSQDAHFQMFGFKKGFETFWA